MAKRSVTIGLATAAIMIITIVVFYLILFNSAARHYTFNEEIRGFPIAQISMTFTDWKVISMSPAIATELSLAYNENDLVIVNCTFRNIGNTNFSVHSPDNLSSSLGQTVLKYGNSSYAALTLTEIGTPLMTNQTSTGWLCYEITNGTQPTQLLFPSKDSPSIIVDFS